MCQVPPHYSIAPEQAGSLGEEGARIWGIRKRRKHRDHQTSPSHLKKLRPERSGSSCPTPRARASSGCGGSLCAACSPAVQQHAPPPPSPFIQSLSETGGEKEEPPRSPSQGQRKAPGAKVDTLQPRPVCRLGAAGKFYSLSRLCSVKLPR